VTVLVVGAAGDLGRRVIQALARDDVRVRALVRRPEAIAQVDADEVVLGDLADPDSLRAAFAGAASVFLVSSPVRQQVALETNAIEAAERAGVDHIVKVSNLPVDGLDDGLHGNHRAIERRLAASPVASTVLQPSFFTTVMDRQRDLIARGKVVLPFGPGRIAWVDPDDIAATAAVALTHSIDGPVRVTGPEALDGDEVAARLGVQRLDPPLAEWRDAVVAGGLDPWLADSTVALYEAVARDALADVSLDVERVTGRPPRRAFVADPPALR
jgi:NAD(P)H dehydrogenase (quinone)